VYNTCVGEGVVCFGGIVLSGGVCVFGGVDDLDGEEELLPLVVVGNGFVLPVCPVWLADGLAEDGAFPVGVPTATWLCGSFDWETPTSVSAGQAIAPPVCPTASKRKKPTPDRPR
jgi:hypothetical protein